MNSPFHPFFCSIILTNTFIVRKMNKFLSFLLSTLFFPRGSSICDSHLQGEWLSGLVPWQFRITCEGCALCGHSIRSPRRVQAVAGSWQKCVRNFWNEKPNGTINTNWFSQSDSLPALSFRHFGWSHRCVAHLSFGHCQSMLAQILVIPQNSYEQNKY